MRSLCTRNLLKLDMFDEKSLENVKGIGFRLDGKPYLTLQKKLYHKIEWT